MDELANGLVGDGEFGGDGLHRSALGVKLRHAFVQRQANGTPTVAQTLPLGQPRPLASPLAAVGWFGDDHPLGGLMHLRAHSLQHSLDVVAQVAQKMPAIGDLLGMWQRDVHGFRVSTGPIPGDDLDGRIPA